MAHPDDTDTRDTRDDGQPMGTRVRDRVLRFGDLAKIPPAVPLWDWIYRGTLAQLSGPPGDLKSLVSLHEALRRVCEGEAVVWVAGEGTSGLHRRIAAWCQHHGVDPDEIAERFLVVNFAAQLANLSDMAEIKCLVVDHRAVLVVFDTRARCSVGVDENSATDQGPLIAACDQLVDETGVTVLIIHHAGTNGGHGRGSTAWDGAIWTDVRILREGNIATVRCAKHKDAEDGCPHAYRMAVVELDPDLVPEVDGRPVPSVIVDPTAVKVEARARRDTLDDKLTARLEVGHWPADRLAEVVGRPLETVRKRLVKLAKADGPVRSYPDPMASNGRLLWTAQPEDPGLF